MDFLDVCLYDREMAFDHIQCTVTQQALQCVRTSTIAEIVNGAGMPEALDRYVGNACPAANVSIDTKMKWRQSINLWQLQ
jgi:hypothetical protein